MVNGEDKIHFDYKNEYGSIHNKMIEFEGVLRNIERRFRETHRIIYVNKWKNIWQNNLVQHVKVIV